MRVRQTAGPTEFLEDTQALRAADPVQTNILGSIALSKIDGRAYERAFWFVAEDDDGDVLAGKGAHCRGVGVGDRGGPTAVERRQDVAGFQTGLGGGSVGQDRPDRDAAGVHSPFGFAQR